MQPTLYNIIPKPREIAPYPKPRPRRPAWLVPNIPKKSKHITFTITGTTTLDRDELAFILNNEDELGCFKVVASVNKTVDYVLVGDRPGADWNKAIKRR